MKRHIMKNVYWVGKIDWELRKFHGSEYSTHKGTSYNSYIIQEGKTALIDTVWAPFAKEFVDNLESDIGLNNIDLVVANHAEIDHSGALPELLFRKPDLPIYCTANACRSIKGHYHKDWDFNPVKTGDFIELGNGKKLVFIEAPMLHWPDSMFTYLDGDAILFPNDAFGQHYATEHLFNDLVDQSELMMECIKYYANILTPFSSLVTKKLEEVIAMNLPVKIIAPSHGVIWRKDPFQIVDRYAKWAANYQEDRITILYDTMWDGTRKIAESILEGISEASPSTTAILHNVSKSDKNDVITDIFRSKAILVGSPTINRGLLNAVAGILEEIRGLNFKGKKSASFGCYGWSGESSKMLSAGLKEAGFTIVNDGFTCMWEPDAEMRKKAFEYGKNFAEHV